jgi:hypothetical protein
MGPLDEAIREHLELKRRHGADPGEVAALEAEALGPVRREASSVDELEAAVHDEPGSADEAPAPIQEEHLPLEEVADADEPELADEPPVPLHAHEPDEDLRPAGGQQTAEFSLEDLEEAGGADEPGAAPEPPAPEHEAVAPDEEPEGEDVLEETPEFLQETPEHDRLWFEQRPPKDFDF